MRVLNPGPGEIVDRLTVVARKIVEGGERAKHFEVEMEELVLYWSKTVEDVDSVMANFATASYLLAATNAAIWQREDELRYYSNEGDIDMPIVIAKIAFRIQELNDQRAELVKKINAAAGINREEKL
jgi:hypothetical protein